MKCSSKGLESVAADNMAVSYNRHRLKVDFSKLFGFKRNCGLQDDPGNVSVKYVNKRCSPDRTNSGNSSSRDQKTITITVKTKANTEQKKPKKLKERKAVQCLKKSIAPSLITIDDYLKVLAKKCSTPDVFHTHVHRNQKKRRCSDTCLNTSTPFKTKTIVNTVSLDPKKIPPDCKNLLNHPLIQAQMSIYRCQLNKEKDSGCRTCTSAAIFEVVKCLYDCYKKKKCDPCKCVVCGYLPKDIRKLINEVGRSSASIGVETPSTNRKTRSTMTSEEDELLSMLQNEPKPQRPKITASEKVRIAKAFGIMTPEAPDIIKLDRVPHLKDYNTEYMTKIEAPCPEDKAPLEKTLYRTNIPNEGPSLRVPSKKLRKARASGLLTPLDGKTQEQKEKMLRNLAMNNIPLPEGKTESEKTVIAKVRKDVGLPPGPRNAAEKEKYARAQAAGLLTPLKGKSQPQKENILRSLLENGIPLPEGRTAAEKTLIEKVELDCISKAMFRVGTEKTIKSKARSFVQTLFNKFATETGYMVLVETSCVNDNFHNFQVQGLLTPLEGKATKVEKNKPQTLAKETKSLEKALLKEIEIDVILTPESQGKTLIGKSLRGTEKECVLLRGGQLSSKKSIKKQPDPRNHLEGGITEPKGKLLPCIAIAENPFLKSKTSLENLLHRLLKDKARASNILSERTHKPKASKSESEQTKVVKHLANARLSLAGDYVPLKRENITQVQDTLKLLEKHTCQTSDVGTTIPQKVSKGMVTNVEANIKENTDITLVSAGLCERSVICDKKKLSYRNSYLKIKLSLSDVSNVSTLRETHSVFTETKDIKQTCDIATSLPSMKNSTASDETEILDNILTREIKKQNNINSANDISQISSGTVSTTEDIDSKSTFYFHFVSDDTDNASHSHEKTCERDFDENNADLIYIYKPTLEVDGKGKLTTSSRIILTESYDVTPTSSGSLYLIETGSTTSYDSGSGMTDFSYATKETSETETGTDVYYIQKSEDEYSKDTSSEPRIFWFYRNKVIHNLPGKNAKIYLVSEVKMRQQRNEPAQHSKKQTDIDEHRYGSHNSKSKPGVMQTAPRQCLKRCSSIFIVMSPSNHDELSSEKLGSLIYIGKLDSVSKLKNLKFVPHENTQRIDPSKMCRRHTRNEEKGIKYLVEPRTAFKCSGIRPETPGHASHALPVTNAFTRYSCSKGINNRGNRLEHPAAEIQKQRIPPKYLENKKLTAGRATWNKELQLKLSSCSTTCRLVSRSPEQRIGCSGKRQMGPKNLGVNLDKTGPTRGGKGPSPKAIPRYLYCGNNTSYREKPKKRFPDQRLVMKSSKVCLISTAHSSKYRVPSKVSFSDELKYIKRDRSSKPCKEKCLDPDPKRCPPKNQKECENTSNNSACSSYDEVKMKREKRPQFTIKVSPKVSSRFNLKSPKSNRGSKVRFDHPLPSCSPKESSKQGSKPRAHEKKEPKPCDSEKRDLKSRDAKEKKSKPCDDEKSNSNPSDGETKETKPRDREKDESKPCDRVKKKMSEVFEIVKKKVSSESTPRKTAAKERPCGDKTKNDPGVCSPQPSTDKQTDLSKGRRSQCREIVKRVTSPLKVKVKSVGVDGSGTCRPTGAEQSTAVCPEKDKIPKKRRSKTCGPGGSDNIKIHKHISNSENATKGSADTQMAECPPANDNIKLRQQEAPKCEAISTQDPTEQSNAECIKQQIVTENLCPPSSTPAEQPTDECVKLHQQLASECPQNSIQNSMTQPADENVKLGQQAASVCPTDAPQNSTEDPAAECVKQQMITEEYCPPNSTPNSTEQPAGVCAELRQQIASECQGNCTQDSTKPAADSELTQQVSSECLAYSTQESVSQPCDDNVKLSQQMGTEYPAKPTQKSISQPCDDNDRIKQQTASDCLASSAQDSISQPVNDNARLSQQKTAECPATTIQDSMTQLSDANAESVQQMASECLVPTLTKDSTQRPEGVKQQTASEPPPKPTQDCIQQPANEYDKLGQKGRKKKYRRPAVLPHESRGSECIPKSQMNDDTCCPGQPQPSQAYPGPRLAESPIPCTHERTKQPGEKKSARLWWCKRKKQIILRRHSRPPPSPPRRSVEEKTAETQCERDVRDLAQMTDSLDQTTDSLRQLASDLAQCHCGDTVKPCQCLKELITKSITSQAANTKAISECECPPPILIIKGQTTAKENNSLRQMIDQPLDCPCMDYLDKHNIKPCQCLAKMEQAQSMTSPRDSKKEVCECPSQTPLHIAHCKTEKQDNSLERISKKNNTCECLRPNDIDHDKQEGTCQEMASHKGNKKNITCECSQPMAAVPMAPGQDGQDGSCQGMASGEGGKKKITCECPQPTAAEQSGKDGTRQGMASDQGGKKNITCECPQPTAAEQSGKDGTRQGMTSGEGGKKKITCECPRPTNMVTEQKTAVQCPKEAQPSRDSLNTSQGKQIQPQNKKHIVKKTVICESPSKDKFNDQKTGGQKKKLSISLGKKSYKAAERSSSDEGMDCQNKKSDGVKWCQKKYVISECPPLPEDACDATCVLPEKKKQQKKNAKNQAKIKTGEKKVDTSCTHGSAPCLCKDDPLCRKKKNHTCECPCPPFVEEVDLNIKIKDCPPAPPCPPKEANEKKVQKIGSSGECSQGQMTESKIDKCSYTDRPIKDLCKTKNKASGRGKWGKKKIECICRPDPPTTETGCDPPCVKEQWKMRSNETHSKSGFSVRKKPAPRVDHTMCFEDALAYFEEHPEDDPMRKMKKKVICECPSLEGYGSDALKFCYGG